MTVNTSAIVSGPYLGNGVTTSFAYNFRIEDVSELAVYLIQLSNGNITNLSDTTHYTTTGVGVDAGGTINITFFTPTSDYEVYIKSNRSKTQETNFSSQGAFDAEIHEAAFDKIVFLIQQANDLIERSFRFSDTYTGSAGITLPSPSAGAFLRWASDGLSLINDADLVISQAMEDDMALLSPVSTEIGLLGAIDDSLVIVANNIAAIIAGVMDITTDIDPIFGGNVKAYTGSSVSRAAGTVQTQVGATDFDGDFGMFIVCATEGDGAQLPEGVVAMQVTVFNYGAKAMRIWPFSGDAFVGLLADAADRILLPRNCARTYVYRAQGWVDVGREHGPELIETLQLSAVASAEFTDNIDDFYDEYEFHLINVVPATDAVNLEMTFSNDGGSTYESTLYSKSRRQLSTDVNSSGDSLIELASSIGSAGNEVGFSGKITVNNPAEATATFLQYNGGYVNSSAAPALVHGCAMRVAAEAIDAFKFGFSSGNIESGTIKLFGTRKPT